MGDFKKLILRFTEFVMVIILVLVFFGVFLGILNIFFPSGISFRELMGRSGLSGSAPSDEKDWPASFGEPLEDSVIEDSPVILTMLMNTVKSKRSDGIVWTAAEVGMNLHNRDAVQTLKRSSALISFGRETYLEIDENSLIIINRSERDVTRMTKRSILVMVDGELRGRLIKGKDEKVNLEIATPSAVMKINSRQLKDEGAEFSISINPDQSSTITVTKGIAEVSAQGQSVSVRANQATTVALNARPAAPKPLLDAVTLSLPQDEDTYYYRDLPPKIRFTWSAIPVVANYRFRLAKDPEFQKIVEDEWVTSNSFVHGNLKQGTYFWYVGSREGLPSKIREILLIKDTEPPPLKVEEPPKVIDREVYTLRGITEPGAQIFVADAKVGTNAQGEFECDLKLQRGVNIIVVEAIDRAGNVTYRPLQINAKFESGGN